MTYAMFDLNSSLAKRSARLASLARLLFKLLVALKFSPRIRTSHTSRRKKAGRSAGLLFASVSLSPRIYISYFQPRSSRERKSDEQSRAREERRYEKRVRAQRNLTASALLISDSLCRDDLTLSILYTRRFRKFRCNIYNCVGNIFSIIRRIRTKFSQPVRPTS